MATDLPLSVWPTAQRTARAQRAGRYLEISGTHPAKMLPAIAARAIATYSSPGDLVLDPMAGIGSTLVEAVHLGRDAIGIEYEPAWADLAEANLRYAAAQGATGTAEVICGDARHLTGLVDPAVRGLVGLVLTSPPYGATLHGRVTARPGQGIAKAHNRYSNDPANLAHVGLANLVEAMGAILTDCAQLLRPGGCLAMTVRPYWHAGQLIDLTGAMARTGEAAGLVLFERNVALLAALRGDELVPRTSFFALEQVRKARARGLPRLVCAHEDLLVFAKRHDATATLSAATVTSPPRPGSAVEQRLAA
jgi:modification methylase